MAFAGMNNVAIVVAAVAGWLVGALWYTALSRPWLAAQGRTAESLRQEQAALKGSFGFYRPFVIAFIGAVIMAWILAGVLGHLGPGQVTIKNGVISGAFVWLGFVATTMATNYAFGGRKLALYAIDATHWLLVLAIMGAVIGAFG